MIRYAANTEVSSGKSQSEIERTLLRYGANGYRRGWVERDDKRRIESIEFAVHNREIRFVLPMPSRSDDEFVLTPTGKERSESAAEAQWEQACRQRWRALNLAIKAKLEAVECGISEFEQEFMAHIVDPATGRTMGEIILPQIEQSYAGLEVRIGLPGLPSPEEFADSEA